MNRKRTTSRRAFTLVEAIVVIIIIGVLATVIAPRLISRVGQSKHAVAESNASALANQMKLLLLDCEQIPDSGTIDVLWERPSDVDEDAWQGPYVDKPDDLLDPWGNKYILIVPGEKNIDFDVISYGRDGKPGGEGEDGDVTKP